MFSSLACLRAVVCSTARGRGVINSPLTTAEALLRLVRHNPQNHRLVRVHFLVKHFSKR